MKNLGFINLLILYKMKPTKQTVYLLVNGETEIILAEYQNGAYIQGVKEIQGYFFTSEQLNEYTAGVIKQTLETAAENAETLLWQNNEDLEIVANRTNYIINHLHIKQSITNIFNETFKNFKV
jgi:hypothetical protein